MTLLDSPLNKARPKSYVPNVVGFVSNSDLQNGGVSTSKDQIVVSKKKHPKFKGAGWFPFNRKRLYDSLPQSPTQRGPYRRSQAYRRVGSIPFVGWALVQNQRDIVLSEGEHCKSQSGSQLPSWTSRAQIANEMRVPHASKRHILPATGRLRITSQSMLVSSNALSPAKGKSGEGGKQALARILRGGPTARHANCPGLGGNSQNAGGFPADNFWS